MENCNDSIGFNEFLCLTKGTAVLLIGYEKIYGEEMAQDEFLPIGTEMNDLLFNAIGDGKTVLEAFECAHRGPKLLDVFKNDISMIDDAIKYCQIEYKYFSEVEPPCASDLMGILSDMESVLFRDIVRS